MTKEDEITLALKTLRRQYPGGGALEIGDSFQMLVAVILSARTKDEQVLKLLPGLFSKYSTAQKMAKGDLADITKRVSTIGMYKQKARNLKAMAEKLVSEFDGKVPQTLDELITLPGVGRKTASVIIVGAFGGHAIAVDTHVFRIVNRLGWVRSKTVEDMERKLLRIVPEEQQEIINHTMVPFGRAICVPGKPRCWACPLVDVCAFKDKNLDLPRDADAILEKVKANAEKLETLKRVIQ